MSQPIDDQELIQLVDSLTNFRFVRVLGGGAFGTAIEVHDENESRPKVLKIPRGVETTEALRAEGQHMVKLSNLLDRNIIRLYQFGHTYIQSEGRREKKYYLLMEYGGQCLRSLLGSSDLSHDTFGNPEFKGSGKQLGVERSLEISIDICKGLKAAHGFKDPEIRILHRDIKPENILIDEESGLARIVDFGIARVMERTEGFASGGGTLLYMDPECFEHRANFTSDLYSLGIVMYEMLTGNLPFANFDVRLHESPLALTDIDSSIPQPLNDAVLKTLHRDPETRFQSAEELLEVLLRVQASLNPFPDRFRDIVPVGESRYSARDSESGKKVIISLCESSATEVEIEKESFSASKMSQINSGAPIDVFRSYQILGVVTRYRKLETLSERFPFPERTSDATEEFQRQEGLCRAVAKVSAIVHEANTIHQLFHGHLSPELITFGKQSEIEIQQFGFAPILRARFLGIDDDAPDLFHNFRRYLSPQLVGGKNSVIGPTDEVYSLGVILYRGLTGEFPSDDKPPQDPGKINSLVSSRLDQIVSRCLQRDAYRRYSHPGAVWEALEICCWPDDIVESLGQNALDLFEEGRKTDAYNEILAALKIYAGNAYLHYIKGKLYLMDEAYTWAIPELKTASDIDYKSVEMKLDLAKAYQLAGQLSEAIDTIDEAITLEKAPDEIDLMKRLREEWIRKVELQ